MSSGLYFISALPATSATNTETIPAVVKTKILDNVGPLMEIKKKILQVTVSEDCNNLEIL